MSLNPWQVRLLTCVAVVAGCLFAGPQQALAQDNSTSATVASIPVGPAADNAETSRGISAILTRCMEVHKSIDALHARGRHVSITKSEDEPTTHSESEITVDFVRPGRMAVHSVSASPLLNSTFVANGTSVTMAWIAEESTATEKLSKVMRQPESLAAYTDTRRAGEIIKEYSDVLPLAPIAQLLVSDDYFGMHERGLRFVYEGLEQVNGKECHQVRIIGTNPEVITIYWIDASTSMLWKISYIYSYDEDYNMVDSFAEGVEATMQVTTWDEISTSPEAVNKPEFDWQVSADYTQYVPTHYSSLTDDDEEPGFWESLVSSAANTGNVPTTRSLSADAGPIQLRMAPAMTLPEGFSPESVSVSTVRMPGQTREALAFASEDGVITIRSYDNVEITSVSLGRKISHFDCMESTSGELLQFVTATADQRQVMGWAPGGKHLWTYEHEDYPIKSVECGDKEPCVYALVNGVRKINQQGKVLFGTLTGEYGNLVTPMPHGADRLVVRFTYALQVLDKSLNRLDRISATEAFVSTRWDEENTTAPFVSLMATRQDRDVLVQRRTESGDVIWTATVAPRLTDVQSGGVVWARLLVNGKVQRCLLTAVSTGHILVLSPDGNVLYRGRVNADAATVERNGGAVIANMELADANGDGVDEFYIVMEREILRLESF